MYIYLEDSPKNHQRQQHFLAVVPDFESMGRLSEPKRPFSAWEEDTSSEEATEKIGSTFCSAAAGTNSKLPLVENECPSSIEAAQRLM